MYPRLNRDRIDLSARLSVLDVNRILAEVNEKYLISFWAKSVVKCPITPEIDYGPISRLYSKLRPNFCMAARKDMKIKRQRELKGREKGKGKKKKIGKSQREKLHIPK